MKHYPQQQSAADYYARLEEANERNCYECAERNGHTVEEADKCDNGSVGCPDCPFK